MNVEDIAYVERQLAHAKQYQNVAVAAQGALANLAELRKAAERHELGAAEREQLASIAQRVIAACDPKHALPALEQLARGVAERALEKVASINLAPPVATPETVTQTLLESARAGDIDRPACAREVTGE